MELSCHYNISLHYVQKDNFDFISFFKINTSILPQNFYTHMR